MKADWLDLFPILKTKINGKRLAYLDNASTTQKPKIVLDALAEYYGHYNSNIHRGVHSLSMQATESYEAARKTVADFIGAPSEKNCIFTKGTTEGLNLLTHSFGAAFLEPGDNIIISSMEHHANIVPWQILCEQKQLELRVIPLVKDKISEGIAELDLKALETLIDAKTKLLSITYVSNALGVINPIEKIIGLAKKRSIPVCVDAAQAVAHLPIDVQALDCDFLVFSGHKLYGPTGIGVLYAKEKWLEAMPPYQSGGDMILQVSFEKTVYNQIPYKFEAGTPPISAAIGLGVAIHFLLEELGPAQSWSNIIEHEKILNQSLEEGLGAYPDIKILNSHKVCKKIGVTSFVLDGIHPHDIGSILDRSGVAIRTGHHCTMPLLKVMGISATARASLGVYNTEADVEQFLNAMLVVRRFFKKCP
ncbi:MAG: SufS family cysteine desulfurase [Gammaproteobacteria bacterium]